jgi:CRISPR-associated protein Cas2
MRTLLFFDLPNITTTDRRNYRRFIKLLKLNGFYMIQESVYSKMCIDIQSVDATINKLKKSLPPDGNIFAINVTEKQFSQMVILLGESKSDVITSDERIIDL